MKKTHNTKYIFCILIFIFIPICIGIYYQYIYVKNVKQNIIYKNEAIEEFSLMHNNKKLIGTKKDKIGFIFEKIEQVDKEESAKNGLSGNIIKLTYIITNRGIDTKDGSIYLVCGDGKDFLIHPSEEAMVQLIYKNLKGEEISRRFNEAMIPRLQANETISNTLFFDIKDKELKDVEGILFRDNYDYRYSDKYCGIFFKKNN